MAETPQVEIPDIPDAVAVPRRRHTVQLVWILPIVAAIIGLALAVRSYLEKGPTITITFKTGEGLEANKTKIKYKDVDVGEVKEIDIARDRSHVVVTAELRREAAGFLVENSHFWVVRARVTGSNVSGLGTLLGGSYIALDAGTSTKPQRVFTGLEVPPVVSMDVPGSRYILHATDLGSLNIGSPVFFRRLEVGQVVGFQLDPGGGGLKVTIFVAAPYDQFVKESAVFWHASGVDINLNTNGLKVRTESMVSLLVGGIAFQNAADSATATRAPGETRFPLFSSREEAMSRPASAELFTMLFRESVRGLTVGAPVDFRGVTVGEVMKIAMDYNPAEHDFTIPVEVRLYPDRLRSARPVSAKQERAEGREFLKHLVDKGFRAQLRSGNLLTGQLYVALDFFPHARGGINWHKNPPEFPVVHLQQADLQLTLLRLAEKFDRIPLEELSGDVRLAIGDLRRGVQSADRLITQLDKTVAPEARATLESVRKTLGGAEEALSGDAPLNQDLRGALLEIRKAARSLRLLADHLERNPESLLRGNRGEP